MAYLQAALQMLTRMLFSQHILMHCDAEFTEIL